jgi:hypothetical protein
MLSINGMSANSPKFGKHDTNRIPQHTGALGLMITLGGRDGCRLGVPGPPPPGDKPPIALKRSGAAIECCPGFIEFIEFIEFDCANGAGVRWLALDAPPSFGGRGLFRGSLSDVVDADGVATGDCAASLDELADGDEVPSFESLFLDLDDLFGSFDRESCSCWIG